MIVSLHLVKRKRPLKYKNKMDLNIFMFIKIKNNLKQPYSTCYSLERLQFVILLILLFNTLLRG